MSEVSVVAKEKEQLRGEQSKQEEKIAVDNQWHEGVNVFYGYIEDCLSDLIEEKIISTSYEYIMIFKQSLGTYYTNRLILKAGGDKIEFLPIVKSVVGTTGKIKMKTKKGNMVLIRDIDGIWKQLVSRSPFRVETLTRSYVRALLKSCCLNLKFDIH